MSVGPASGQLQLINLGTSRCGYDKMANKKLVAIPQTFVISLALQPVRLHSVCKATSYSRLILHNFVEFTSH